MLTYATIFVIISFEGGIVLLTSFGIALRKLRLDRGEILKTMADNLEISSSYLSAIEVGKRNIPEYFIDKLKVLYNLEDERVNELETAKLESQKEIVLALENISIGKREAALLFARKFDDLDELTTKKIKKLINSSMKDG